jgi:hypothetical protein
MWPSFHFLWLLCFSNLALAAVIDLGTAEKDLTISPRSPSNPFPGALQSLLSANATITYTAPIRWSQFDAPTPGAVVNVATEQDVHVTVRHENLLIFPWKPKCTSAY